MRRTGPRSNERASAERPPRFRPTRAHETGIPRIHGPRVRRAEADGTHVAGGGLGAPPRTRASPRQWRACGQGAARARPRSLEYGLGRRRVEPTGLRRRDRSETRGVRALCLRAARGRRARRGPWRSTAGAAGRRGSGRRVRALACLRDGQGRSQRSLGKGLSELCRMLATWLECRVSPPSRDQKAPVGSRALPAQTRIPNRFPSRSCEERMYAPHYPP